MSIVVAVDHGNSMVKTPTTMFNANVYCVSEAGDAAFGEAKGILKYEGKSWVIDDADHVPYHPDKTEDRQGRFFIMNLFAIAKELLAREDYEANANETPLPITLSMGLPPGHYNRNRDKYIAYFTNNGKPIEFDYGDTHFNVKIVDTIITPQGYAVLLSPDANVAKLLEEPAKYVVDIGGRTTDWIYVLDNKPQIKYTGSEDKGVNQCLKQISRYITQTYSKTIMEAQIQKVLIGEERSGLTEELEEAIRKQEGMYAMQIMDWLRELGINFEDVPTIFCGGGALIFEPYIRKSYKLNEKSVFVKDIAANAKGYLVIATQKAKKGKK